MKKTSFIAAIFAFMLLAINVNAQSQKLPPIKLRVNILSVPYQLESPYAHGTVTFEYSYTQSSKGYHEYQRPYNGLGVYSVYGDGPIPSHVILGAHVYISTNRWGTSEKKPPYYWVGKAKNSKHFEGYHPYYEVSISETDFYYLKRVWLFPDEAELEITN